MKVNIIGRGNVAYHLKGALTYLAEVKEINPHTLDGLDKDADIILIAVADDAIREVISRLSELEGIVAHTSGSTSLSVFEGTGIRNYGVFYPMQTFSKSKPLDYKRIPIYIEGSDMGTTQVLQDLASLVSPIVRRATSEQRKALHIAAVLSCNFVNHLWTLSADFLNENGMKFSDMLPLIEETLDKVKSLPPDKAQTGPAVRGDMNIIESHLELLKDRPQLENVYRTMSESIYNTHHKQEK